MYSETLQKWRPISEEEVVLVRRLNAKRYIVRVNGEGKILVTVPRGGSRKGAIAFAREHAVWLRQQQSLAEESKQRLTLAAGDWIWFRGEKAELVVTKKWGRPLLSFADQNIYIADEETDLARPLVKALRAIAKSELPQAVAAFASQFGLKYEGVSIRDQKTRWGSCSSTGRISLNWRLVMTPPQVSDYIVIHELMHLKEMNHSHLFWRLVREVCPDYKAHERWLEKHQSELTFG